MGARGSRTSVEGSMSRVVVTQQDPWLCACVLCPESSRLRELRCCGVFAFGVGGVGQVDQRNTAVGVGALTTDTHQR